MYTNIYYEGLIPGSESCFYFQFHKFKSQLLPP